MVSYIYAYPFGTTVTANATNRGNATLNDVQGVYVGQIGWLRSNTAGPVRVKVLALNTTTKVVSLQILPDIDGKTATGMNAYNSVSFNPSDLSAFLLADTPTINFPGQVVKVNMAFSKPGALV